MIHVLLDAVLGALCALGVRRAVLHAKRAKRTRNPWLLGVRRYSNDALTSVRLSVR